MINEEWTKHKMMPLLSPFTEKKKKNVIYTGLQGLTLCYDFYAMKIQVHVMIVQKRHVTFIDPILHNAMMMMMASFNDREEEVF